jgi:hypothetical protein
VDISTVEFVGLEPAIKEPFLLLCILVSWFDIFVASDCHKDIPISCLKKSDVSFL